MFRRVLTLVTVAALLVAMTAFAGPAFALEVDCPIIGECPAALEVGTTGNDFTLGATGNSGSTPGTTGNAAGASGQLGFSWNNIP